jgi:hypothetical protein
MTVERPDEVTGMPGFGDAYYLSQKSKSPRRAGFGPPRTYPCPCCYRPQLQRGYCDRCVASGGAERHQARLKAESDRNERPATRRPADTTPPGDGARTSPTPRPRAKDARPTVAGPPRAPMGTVTQRRARFIAAIRAFVAETGEIPTTSRWQREKRRPAHTEAYKLFDSWADALAAAGIPIGRRP